MKNPAFRFALGLVAAFALGFLSGCASSSAAGGEAKILQRVLSEVLPPDFSGPVHLEHRNQYFDLAIDAGGVRQAGGVWQWDWLEYERKSHFPLFSGLAWASSGRVRLGARPAGTIPAPAAFPFGVVNSTPAAAPAAVRP
jgi:hypothetical protein